MEASMADQEFNPDAVRNPSTGILARNPTHIREAEGARNQTDIVKAIVSSGKKRQTMVLKYDVKKDIVALPGMLDIRGMNSTEASALCRSLVRFRPNIFYVYIKLGNYPNAKKVNDIKVTRLNLHTQVFPTEVADLMGELLSDRALNIVEMVYEVEVADAGKFRTTCQAVGVSLEDYKNDENFNPTVTIDFITEG
jgi:hypothetical protein